MVWQKRFSPRKSPSSNSENTWLGVSFGEGSNEGKKTWSTEIKLPVPDPKNPPPGNCCDHSPNDGCYFENKNLTSSRDGSHMEVSMILLPSWMLHKFWCKVQINQQIINLQSTLILSNFISPFTNLKSYTKSYRNFSNKLGLEVHVISTAYRLQIYSGRFGAKLALPNPISKPLTPLMEVFGPDLLGGFSRWKRRHWGSLEPKTKRSIGGRRTFGKKKLGKLGDWLVVVFWTEKYGRQIGSFPPRFRLKIKIMFETTT